MAAVRVYCVAFFCLVAASNAALQYCAGEYSLCADGSCALVNASCGNCAAGQYACLLTKTCFSNLDDYRHCENLKGTHLDWTLGEEERLDKLVAAVNLSQMIGQLVNNAPAIDEVALPAYNWLNDDEHGVKGTSKAAVYPMGVTLGSSWNKQLVKAVGRAIGVEARSTHNTQADKSGNNCGSTSTGQVTANGCGITLYAPNINLVRDPRWGRAEEVYGEDPHLTSELAVAMVTGIQGNRELESVAEDGGALMAGASCKHYAVYDTEDLPEARYVLDANVSARDLWETYLPVMKACVVRARATHVMCSYNAVNGKPTCAHPELLNDVLRGQWRFDGFVVSDYDAWINLVTTHKVVDTYEEAAALGINSGMDQEGGFGTYSAIDAMPAAVSSGNVSESTVQTSFRRLMRVRMRLGMLDPPAQVAPNNSTYTCEAQCETPEKLQLAQQAAREGIVLLKNANNALPLKRANFVGRNNSLAVVGPMATDWRVLLGAANYAFQDGPSLGCITILTGITAALGNDTAGLVAHINGCPDAPCATANITAASAIAKAAKATVLVLGDSFGAATGWPLCQGTREDGCESEQHDRGTIELPGQQMALAQAVKAASNGPVVCVLTHGGALALGSALEACDAVLSIGVAGQMGGAALADILFGDYSPAGRSPVTFYSATSDLPAMGEFNEYPHENSNGTTYRYYKGAPPTFRFGDGLSYTTFEYSQLRIPSTAQACSGIPVTVTVTNTGHDHASDEVVQVYVATPNSSVPSPMIRLAAFERVPNIAPGASQTLSLTIQAEAHAVVLESSSVYDAKLAVEAGPLEVHVGGHQPGPGGTLSGVVQITNCEAQAGPYLI